MIYLDHAATTPMHKEVYDAMIPYMEQYYGNPSGTYEFSSAIKEKIEEVRSKIALSIEAAPEEIYFTSGGTESDNWALRGICQEGEMGRKKHIITTQIEHHAILHTCESLEKQNIRVTYLPVDERGLVKMGELKKSIQNDTVLISVMYANNEIGTIEPIEEIGAYARKHNVLFHTDAVQAYGHIPISVKKTPIDMLSASGHKLGGPKGIGFLYVKKGICLSPILTGGSQERGMRAGTEYVPGIIGLGKAVELWMKSKESITEEGIKQNKGAGSRVLKMREHLTKRILSEIPFVTLNGDQKKRLPGNCNVSFQFIDGVSLLVLLDTRGICASAGSACNAASQNISHVLKAIHLPKEIIRGTLRMTIGEENTMEEMDKTVEILKELVAKLREGSAEYEDVFV